MKAMILAAGRGERMRPLTDSTPKPLLRVNGKPLIEYHLERLKRAGYRQIVINTHHLGNQIQNHLGNGHRFGMEISYSPEAPEALETGGGIFQALPLLGEGPFLVINGDIWSECSLEPPDMPPDTLAHLILVPNPPHNPNGDFGLHQRALTNTLQPGYTFSGIGWYQTALFVGCQPGKFPLAPLLRKAIDKHRINGHLCTETWMDIGTPQRLQQIATQLRA